MKLKSMMSLFAALTGLALLPAHSNADTQSTTAFQQTYGSALTKDFVATVRVNCCAGKLTADVVNARGAAWSIQLYAVTSMAESVDSQLNLHSVVTAQVYFTGGSVKSAPAIATYHITKSVSGQETMGLDIVDYSHPPIAFYTSGSELPVLQGGITIVNP